MRIPQLPKNWLVHTVIYYPPTGQKDDFGKDIEGDPIEMKYARVDVSTVFSRDTRQNQITANAVIFLDAVHTNPLPLHFKEGARISFKGKDFTIKKPIPYYHPHEDRLHHWEIEVV